MRQNAQSGSIFYFILIAIVLIGGLTLALRDSGGLEGNVDKESANVQASQILKYSGEVERAVQTLISNGVSESDIRFAYPSTPSAYGTITVNPQNQVFSSQGGKAAFRDPPANALASPATYVYSAGIAMVGIGSDKADLIMTAFPLKQEVCEAVNKSVGITTIPTMSNCPLSAYFTGAYSASPVIPSTTITATKPYTKACINCTNWSAYLYYSILLAR